MRKQPSTKRIRVGISSCLLGNKVRHDGGDKHNPFVIGTLGRYFEFVPICPEMGIGMGVPRAPIQLVGDPERPRAVGVYNVNLDVTEALKAYGERISKELEEISGYVLKSNSPSCGMSRVRVYRSGRLEGGKGVGVYARELTARRPLLPVEEESRLSDSVLCGHFIERIFAYRRWQELNG